MSQGFGQGSQSSRSQPSRMSHIMQGSQGSRSQPLSQSQNMQGSQGSRTQLPEFTQSLQGSLSSRSQQSGFSQNAQSSQGSRSQSSGFITQNMMGSQSARSSFSQNSTQDVYSQKNSQTSFTSSQSSIKGGTSLFDKWENGKTQNRTLSLREDTPMSSSQNEEMEQNGKLVTSFFESRFNSNQARNDRVMMENLIQGYKELEQINRAGLLDIQDRLQEMSNSQYGSISETVTQWLCEIKDKESEILRCLADFNSKIKPVSELECQLAVKDMNIQSLTVELEASKKGETERLASAVRQKIQSPLQKCLEENNEVHRKRYTSEHKDIIEHIQSGFNKVHSEFQNVCLDLKKSVTEDIVNCFANQGGNAVRLLKKHFQDSLTQETKKRRDDSSLKEELTTFLNDKLASISHKLELSLSNYQVQLRNFETKVNDDLSQSRQLSSTVESMKRSNRYSGSSDEDFSETENRAFHGAKPSNRYDEEIQHQCSTYPHIQTLNGRMFEETAYTSHENNSNNPFLSYPLENENQNELVRKVRPKTPSRTPSAIRNVPSTGHKMYSKSIEQNYESLYTPISHHGNENKKKSSTPSVSPISNIEQRAYDKVPFKSYEHQQICNSRSYRPFESPFNKVDQQRNLRKGPSPVATVFPQQKQQNNEMRRTESNIAFNVRNSQFVNSFSQMDTQSTNFRQTSSPVKKRRSHSQRKTNPIVAKPNEKKQKVSNGYSKPRSPVIKMRIQAQTENYRHSGAQRRSTRTKKQIDYRDSSSSFLQARTIRPCQPPSPQSTCGSEQSSASSCMTIGDYLSSCSRETVARTKAKLFSNRKSKKSPTKTLLSFIES